MIGYCDKLQRDNIVLYLKFRPHFKQQITKSRMQEQRKTQLSGYYYNIRSLIRHSPIILPWKALNRHIY